MVQGMGSGRESAPPTVPTPRRATPWQGCRLLPFRGLCSIHIGYEHACVPQGGWLGKKRPPVVALTPPALTEWSPFAAPSMVSSGLSQLPVCSGRAVEVRKPESFTVKVEPNKPCLGQPPEPLLTTPRAEFRGEIRGVGKVDVKV